MSKYICNIVFHTHWDREWYLSFEEYRYRLTQVIKRVVSALESGDIEYFVLDGQVAAIEDYLAICEDIEKEKVLDLTRQGKFILGPWYVLADEFLVSGESLIRNLEIGIKETKKYGKPQIIGYLPDTFGHIGQMPQILKGFGINNALLWRGVKPEKSEFIWEGNDGTKILTIFLPEGYYQPIVDQPSFEEGIEKFIEKIKSYATTDELLLTNGGDHLMPSMVSISERINRLNDIYKNEIEFKVTNYEEYMNNIENKISRLKLEKHKGELRDNSHIYILPNVLSTRTYLKQQNQLIEDYITGYLEPLVAVCYQDDDIYPSKYLYETWKLLLQNHPHDSICGCSIDAVHKEMEIRTLKLKQRINSIEKGCFHKKGWLEYTVNGNGLDKGTKIFEDNTKFTIFNPHIYSYSGEVRGTIWLSKENELNKGFIIKDREGNRYKPTIIRKRENRFFASPTDYPPEFRQGVFYDISFFVDNLPGLSLKSYELIEGEYIELKSNNSRTIENQFIKVTVEQDGTITLVDKALNKKYTGLNKYYSSLDNGDEYNYSKPKDDIITYGELKGDIKSRISDDVKELTYTVELKVPKSLNEERTKGTTEKATIIIDVTLTITNNSKEIKTGIRINNRAKDQRLRVRFPLGTEVDYTYSDSAFDIVKRKANRKEVFKAERLKEVPVVVDPSLSMVIGAKNNIGIVFYHRGIQEYQVVKEQEESVLEATLIRSVGWLSRDDFDARGGGAGPSMETPDAQCIGIYEFEYVFRPVDKDWKASYYLTKARLFRVPVKIYSGFIDEEVKSLFEIDNKNIQWSSIRKTDNGIEIRIWNPNEDIETFNIIKNNDIKKIEEISLDKEIVKIIDVNKPVTIKPKKIKTFLINI